MFFLILITLNNFHYHNQKQILQEIIESNKSKLYELKHNFNYLSNDPSVVSGASAVSEREDRSNAIETQSSKCNLSDVNSSTLTEQNNNNTLPDSIHSSNSSNVPL